MDLMLFLKSVYGRYPQSELQDVYKALFQACLGPEHLLRDVAAARGYLEQELAAIEPEPGPLVEPLSQAFCRINLRPAAYSGLTTEAIFSAFSQSAEIRGSMVQLEQCLAKWPHLAVNRDTVKDFVADILAQGCPALHHSPTYRALYRPAYRVVHMRFVLPEWI